MPSPYLTGEISTELLQRKNVQVNIETQRGCNLRCSYCLYHADFPKIRYRDVQAQPRKIISSPTWSGI